MIYHGYSRANRCIYENKAVCSSSDGLSGKRAMVVWKSFQLARPSSALFKHEQIVGFIEAFTILLYFRVSFPSFPIIASPLSVASPTETWCIGTDFVSTMDGLFLFHVM